MNKENIHPLQQRILAILEEKQKLPRFRELTKILGVASTNTVAYHINILRRKGYLHAHDALRGIIELTIKNLASLPHKGGVYVLYVGKKPFFVAYANDIPSHLIDLLQSDADFKELLKSAAGAVTMAYHFIPESEEQKDLAEHLCRYYEALGHTVLYRMARG